MMMRHQPLLQRIKVISHGQRSMVTIVARSRLRPEKFISKNNKKTTEPEGSWPRSVVIGFFATMSIVVPYTASWYLSQHNETRDVISGILNLDDSAWDPIRRRFGERDFAGDLDTYKFEDEPDCNIRQTQKDALKRNQENINVKILHLTDEEPYSTIQEEVVVLPASSLARHATFTKESKMIALDFPDDEPIDESAQDVSIGEPSTPTPYQVYSAWYYFPEPVVEQTPSQQTSSRLATASELAYVEAELAQLDREVKQGRSLDDPYIQDRMRQLKAERRRLQWNRWLGI